MVPRGESQGRMEEVKLNGGGWKLKSGGERAGGYTQVEIQCVHVEFYLELFSLEGNCFTMLCWFLPHSSVNQFRAHTHTSPAS